MNLSLYIGNRYSRAKRRNGFISFISLTSMIGIALGVWALITVISIMNGFGNELRQRILDVTAHATVRAPGGWLSDWQSIKPALDDHPRVVGYAPYIYAQGLLSKDSAVSGVLIRGIDPATEARVSAIATKMDEGSIDDLQAGAYQIILGEGLAFKLQANLGDKVTLIAPKGQSTPAGLMPRLRRFTVVGSFRLGAGEYDDNLALIHINDAAKIYKAGQQVSGVRLKLDDVYAAAQISSELEFQLSNSSSYYYVDNWTRQHENFFRALKIERRVMFIILFLIVAVAAFNIVSTLVMVVTDKRADIAILRTLGMTPNQVMGVFFVQGATSGFFGTLIGASLGVLTAINVPTLVPFIENLVGHQLFPSNVYIISDFPAELRWQDVSTIVFAAIGVSMLATLYPAYSAARTQPAEALRYE